MFPFWFLSLLPLLIFLEVLNLYGFSHYIHITVSVIGKNIFLYDFTWTLRICSWICNVPKQRKFFLVTFSQGHWSSLDLFPSFYLSVSNTFYISLNTGWLLSLLSWQVVSNSLWLHGLQHGRLPCPSPSPGVCPNSCPLNQWCHPTISSSVVPFSLCSQSFWVSGSFPMSWLFASSDPNRKEPQVYCFLGNLWSGISRYLLKNL